MSNLEKTAHLPARYPYFLFISFYFFGIYLFLIFFPFSSLSCVMTTVPHAKEPIISPVFFFEHFSLFIVP